MAFQVLPTTAEHVIATTDAVLLAASGCDVAFVADFLDVPEENARNALHMATQLRLLEHDSSKGYTASRPLAVYLVTAKEAQRAAVLRVMLEDYEPYRVFKARLDAYGLAPKAAEEVKSLFKMSRHRDEIKDTLVNLGTYAQSLSSEGAGLFRVAELDTRRAGFLEVVAEVAADRAYAEGIVRRRLGPPVAAGLDETEVLSPLVTAYQQLYNKGEPRSPVLYAGNAVESFLTQLAAKHGVNLSGAPGINAKVEKIAQAGHLATKHKFILKYIGHVRNAADHGTDAEINSTWDIGADTAVEYVHVALSAVKSVVLALGKQYVL